MNIEMLKLSNFRCYRGEQVVKFDNLTAFVGKNDTGKSSILEALDIFFNDGKGCIKLDGSDINTAEKENENFYTTITVCFNDVPKRVVIDATNETTLENEYLLNEDHQLEVVKKYHKGGSAKTFIRAFHPTNPNCSDLLLRKDKDLREILSEHNICCADQKRNAAMRRAIWDYYSSDLQLRAVEIDVTLKDDVHAIWDKLMQYLPMYVLFQADRKNTDCDDEIQDPLKAAVKEILNDEEIIKTLSFVAERVEKRLTEVSSRTLDKLREMNPEVANSLNPIISPAAGLKWVDVFKGVSITGDDNIPINKRGSGVKRLVLLNFFRAEAERRLHERQTSSIVYAIEEPETSQHTENQKRLICSLLELAKASNTQIVITTHSASIVKKLKYDNLRLISNTDGLGKIEQITSGQLPYPSLNEVNYLAFSEVTEEYHDELFGFIEERELLPKYKEGKDVFPYIRFYEGNKITKDIVLSEYIRHQIHHPENKSNTRYTEKQLLDSIELMRCFIDEHRIQCLPNFNEIEGLFGKQ